MPLGCRPREDGKFGVLPGHIRFLSAIVPGELHYTNGSKTEYMAVSSGFAEVNNDIVSVLVDSAETAGNIDVKRAMSAMERAKQRLAKRLDAGDTDLARAEASTEKGRFQAKVSEKVMLGKENTVNRMRQACSLPFLLTFF
jgi:F-type H+-transporting ATPase subunit epsilon